MLDRGEQVDWFNSAETSIYLGLVPLRHVGFVRARHQRREHPFMELGDVPRPELRRPRWC